MNKGITTIISELHKTLRENQISTNETVLELHSKDESYHTPSKPNVVIFPETTEQVRTIIMLANDHGIPLYPFGMGSSLEGHVIPYEQGITFDF